MIHPHANRCWVDGGDSIANALHGGFPACLGEAQSAVHTAMRKNDVAGVVHAVLTWLRAADSNDEWGAAWKAFPTELRRTDEVV